MLSLQESLWLPAQCPELTLRSVLIRRCPGGSRMGWMKVRFQRGLESLIGHTSSTPPPLRSLFWGVSLSVCVYFMFLPLRVWRRWCLWKLGHAALLLALEATVQSSGRMGLWVSGREEGCLGSTLLWPRGPCRQHPWAGKWPFSAEGP